jgi:hypothetical protein
MINMNCPDTLWGVYKPPPLQIEWVPVDPERWTLGVRGQNRTSNEIPVKVVMGSFYKASLPEDTTAERKPNHLSDSFSQFDYLL